ncbi:MAG: TSUP family transporter, partial [Clostridia bacterium]
MILDWSCFLIVCPLCFVAGCIDAIAGGGGLISLPAYYLAGLPPHLAAGTNKLSASIGTTVAACRYFRSGKIAWKPALLAALGALPGAYAGAELLKRLNDGMILQM